MARAAKRVKAGWRHVEAYTQINRHDNSEMKSIDARGFDDRKKKRR